MAWKIKKCLSRETKMRQFKLFLVLLLLQANQVGLYGRADIGDKRDSGKVASEEAMNLKTVRV